MKTAILASLLVLGGMALGWLASVALQPATSGVPFFQWVGVYRDQVIDSADLSPVILDCPRKIAHLRLKTSNYVTGDGMECEYQDRLDEHFVLWVNLVPAGNYLPEGLVTFVRFRDGHAAGERVTNLDKGDKVLGTDVLSVEGSRAELSVTCYQFETPLDANMCYTLQEAYFLGVERNHIGLTNPR